MPVKDKVVTWWIQNIIIPKQEIIDKPGFVVSVFTEKKFTTYLREFFLPELLFEFIENKIVQQYGDQGRHALYSAGKKFGYIYASMSNFTTINNSTAKEISDFAYLLVRYIEGTYAQQAEHIANVEQRTFSIYFDNYIICRHNGFGHIMTEGGITGIWSYGMQDKSVEGVQLQCQGRGDERCFVICAPETRLLEQSKKIFREHDLHELKADVLYSSMNELRKTTYVKNSLKDLLNAGFFNFTKGILSYKNHRFFHCDSHLLYLIDEEVDKLPNGEQTLFETGYEYGRLLQEIYGGKDYKKFIPDFFSALGFGDIVILDSETIRISLLYYPWTVYSAQSKYIILRGVLSGFVSSSLGKEIRFKAETTILNKYLTVTLAEVK